MGSSAPQYGSLAGWTRQRPEPKSPTLLDRVEQIAKIGATILVPVVTKAEIGGSGIRLCLCGLPEQRCLFAYARATMPAPALQRSEITTDARNSPRPTFIRLAP